MGMWTMAAIFKCLLLMLLGSGWPGLGNTSVKAAQLREHNIAAQFTSWNYSSQHEELSRLPHPSFKKIVYQEYEADFKTEKPRNALLGLLGPTLRAEVGDTLIIHFRNFVDRPLNIHPQSPIDNKKPESSSYFDKASLTEGLVSAVPPGQMHTYVWEVTAAIGPKAADPPCLTYAYYSQVNMVADFNSGLIGALLICKEGSLHENGTQKLFDREYVLMFAVLDESKSWGKGTSLMYTINGYANGTLPDVQACCYDRISWHLIGMSSMPEIFSIHFNGQTLEQDRYKVSTVSLVAGASATANMSVSMTGRWLISSLITKHLQAGMHGYLNIEDCGKPDTLTMKLTFRQWRFIKDWDYFIAAEEITWDYDQDIVDNVDKSHKSQCLDIFSNLIGKKYKKAVFRQYKDATFSKRIEDTRPKEHGILGPIIRAQVRDKIKIVFKNMASRPYSIYAHGVTLSKDAEGAVYPSDSKENSTKGAAVQPGEVYTYTWTVRDTDAPTAKDASCVTRFYHSAVDTTRDIASGLIGPLLVCKPKALDTKGIQNKADEEQHAVFAVFDENKSWYLEENIKKYCSNPSTVKRDDPKFYNSNVIKTLNGFASDRKHILGFCQSEVVEWHLSSVGTQDEIVPVYLAGHTFLSRGKHQDILNLFPMDGKSATVTMDNIGMWLLSLWGSREMSYGMRLRFRDAKCNDYNEEEEEEEEEEEAYDFGEEDVAADVVHFSPKETEPANDSKDNNGTVAESQDGGALSEVDKEQEMLAAMLGLRTFKETLAQEEEVNLTAIALQDDTSGSNSVSNDGASVNSRLVFTNHNDSLHSDKVLEIHSTTSYPSAVESLRPNYTSLAREILLSAIPVPVSTLSSDQGQSHREKRAHPISDNYTQTLRAEHLRTDGGVQRKDTEELWVDGENNTKAAFAVTSSVTSSMEEQEKSASGNDTLDGKSENHVLTEAILFALKEMRALLHYVQQKRNISALGNTTSDSKFFAIPSTENASSLENLETYNFSYYYEEYEEEVNPPPPMLSSNLTLAVGETVENNRSEPLQVSELQLLKVQQNGNLTLDGVSDTLISTLIPKTVKSLKKLPKQRRKCPPKKTDYEWNAVSEKKSYETPTDLTRNIDNNFQNSSINDTMYLENAMFPSKEMQKAHKGDSHLELGQPEMSHKHEKRNENCTVSTSGTFLKARRKKKAPHASLSPRTSKPLGRLSNSQLSVIVNQNYTLAQTPYEATVKIGFPVENGDYKEYDLDMLEYDKIDDEESSSGSFEYQVQYYHDPYTMDSRLDTHNKRSPEAIAGIYLRTTGNRGNVRKYYIAAEEVFWDYGPSRRSTEKSSLYRSVYRKVIFQSYLDDTFKIPIVDGEYEEHLGILGPVIRAEVDDVIQVQFKNLASRPYSLHAHGLYYEKSSEGRSYDDQSLDWFKKDDAIMPNDTYTYVWHATKRSGPMQNQRVCRSWAYYSAVNPEKDIHSGLIGPILVCQKGMLDEYNRPIDVREFVLLFMAFDEEKSWYFDKKTRAGRPSRAQHKFPAINGIQYQLEGLRMYKDEAVHWHLLNLGGPQDIHVINFHGQTFTEQGMEDHQLGVYPLLSGSFTTVKMKPSTAGMWLLETEVAEYQEAGMQASFTVIDKECRLPMGMESGVIEDSQISASGHIGYWEPKLARLNNSGKYNAWSTDKKNALPWIQVDLRRHVLITGIQTQGAKALLKSLYTMEYFIAYSNDGRKWINFKGNYIGISMPFEGNSDAHGIKENTIDPPIVTRYIRVFPSKSYNRPTLRIELLGCETEVCSMPLGMESGAIKDAQITASSFKKTWWSSWEPSLARLNLKGRTNAWQPKSSNHRQWLQINLLQPMKITGIITQGAKSMNTKMYVKTFSILYSDDGSAWKPYLDGSNSFEKVFTGNINNDGQIKHFFKPPIVSGFIRIVPKTWNQSIALRLELFGCDAS
ncbi:coagulation factor V [Elgaria multicarinata webbii]|uniref:coagulation factor V n=1 Tax=Elgaria multicarinata webbii TaxID=159646 RepID=UPI002FCCBE09